MLMDKDRIRGFLRFLEEATDEELLQMKQRLVEVKSFISDREHISDLNWYLKRLESEQLARLELVKTVKNSK